MIVWLYAHVRVSQNQRNGQLAAMAAEGFLGMRNMQVVGE